MIWSISDIMKSSLVLDPIFQVIRQVISLSRHNAPVGWGSHNWSQYYKAKMDDNPQYALIIAWGILEKEAQRSFNELPKIEGKNPAIVNNSKSTLDLSSFEHGNLKNSMKKRNKVAHGERVEVFWSDVDIVIDVAYRLHQLR